MDIKILGTGCSNCKNLEKVVYKAVEEMNIVATISKVDDIQKIMSYGIMRTPGLVIDEQLVLSGRVPAVKEVVELISKQK